VTSQSSVLDLMDCQLLPVSKRTGVPVPLEVFSYNGLEFQNRFVGELEQTQVESVRPPGEGLQIGLEDGSVLSARRVVVANGLANCEYTPPVLAPLRKEFVTHSSHRHEIDHFRGREVAIFGAGASALHLLRYSSISVERHSHGSAV
jgi:thioredoxin reductase